MGDSIEEAKLALEKDRQERLALAGKEIQEVLKKHGCVLVGEPYFSPDGRVLVRTLIKVVDNDR